MGNLLSWSLAAIVTFAAGCASLPESSRSAHLRDGMDGAYFSKVAVFAVNANGETDAALEAAICQSLTPTPCVLGSSIRTGDNAGMRTGGMDALSAENVDSILLVSVAPEPVFSEDGPTEAGGANYSPDYANAAGYLTNYRGKRSYSGIGRGGINYNEDETIAPSERLSSQPRGSVTLRDAQTGGVAWSGLVHIRVDGVSTMTSRKFNSSASKYIVEGLRSAGFYTAGAD